jgi:single-strand DNA-binding protein
MRNNSVQLIGYVGDSPKIYKAKDGSKRAIIRVATHDRVKATSEVTQYGTTWHTVVAWDLTADYAERSFVSGSQILVSGMLSQRKYLNDAGEIQRITDIRAHYLRNLDR